MKIFQVLNHFMPEQTAGTEVYTWALAKNLKKFNFDVKIILPNVNSSKNETYFYDEIEVIKYSETSIVDRNLIMGERVPAGLSRFIEVIKNEKPDIVHFHEIAGSNGITINHVEAVKYLGIKTIMTFHLAGYTCMTGTMVKFGVELCEGQIDSNVCGQCHLMNKGYNKQARLLLLISGIFDKIRINPLKFKNSIGTAFGTKQLINKIVQNLDRLVEASDRVVVLTNWYRIVLIKNGVSEDKLVHIAQGLPMLSNCDLSVEKKKYTPLKLIFLGRISYYKGLHLLIAALKNIEQSLVTLSIFGCTNDQLYENKLRNESKNLSNVHWYGELAQPDVISMMKKHDVLCLCSTFSEMSPLVIQEAFSAGIPVIASKVHGNVEQVEHGVNGLLFKFNDVKSLRQQIQRLIDDPYLIQYLSANILPPTNFGDVATEYVELYKSLLVQ
jgi:glycosyltransferase involved in cell wall biosynthesis